MSISAKTRSVSAIQNGTVLDHIPAGQALTIMRLLAVVDRQQPVTLGLNLPSQRLGLKDLVKIKNRQLSSNELDQVSVFAPQSTVSLIQQFKVKEKKILILPTQIKGLLLCPNTHCITHTEKVTSHFNIVSMGKRIQLTCCYCEKAFDRDSVGNRLL